MKVLITLDNDGHFGAVLIENENKELQVLRDLMRQIVESRWSFDDQQKAEAYRLSYTGTIDEIKEWMNDSDDLSMGRAGGSKIDLIELNDSVPVDLVNNLVLYRCD